MPLKEQGLGWVRPSLLPCQWVQPCPDGHETSSRLIHPRTVSFSMQRGCPVLSEPGVGDSQHLFPWAKPEACPGVGSYSTTPGAVPLFFSGKTAPSSAAQVSAAASQACSRYVPRGSPFKLASCGFVVLQV